MSRVASVQEYTPAGNARCIKFCIKNNGCHPDICPQNKARRTGCAAKSRNLLWKGIAELWEEHNKNKKRGSEQR